MPRYPHQDDRHPLHADMPRLYCPRYSARPHLSASHASRLGDRGSAAIPYRNGEVDPACRALADERNGCCKVALAVARRASVVTLRNNRALEYAASAELVVLALPGKDAQAQRQTTGCQ